MKVSIALGATWSAYLSGHTTVAMVLATTLLLPVLAALWEGARPEVVSFARDLVHVALDRFRSRLGLPVGLSAHRERE
jgi:hypothetical protein